MAANPVYNPAARDGGYIQPLQDDEIKAFVDELDHNNDGYIDYDEVESKLDAVAAELKPDRNFKDEEADTARHAFLRAIIGSNTTRIKRDVFVERVKEWRIPSLQQEKDEEESQDAYMRRMGFGRRLRSYWAVHGPTIMFMLIVVGMMLAFGIWQLVKYLGAAYSGALGWGVVVAKTCAGMLYPTMFFLLLSMARHFSTLLRRSYTVSRFINWDLSQEFHIYMAITATCLGTLHGIAHLAGDFLWIGNAYRPQQLDNLLGADRSLRTYRDVVKSRAGITGILTLFFFYVIGSTSTPWVRRRNYEVFQFTHLLMYPVIGCLMAHGTAAILQWPMLGYFLAFPTLLILIERTARVYLSFYDIPATIRILDSETVEIKATVPKSRIFNYYAGQYLFLQVPKLSFFQWHPFTISVCRGKDIQLHIKTDGNWTGQLRDLVKDNKPTQITIGLDGPYGAPAQRFYDFSHTILVGSGIGITPFSGILADLQAKDNSLYGGPTNDPLRYDSIDDSSSSSGAKDHKISEAEAIKQTCESRSGVMRDGLSAKNNSLYGEKNNPEKHDSIDHSSSGVNGHKVSEAEAIKQTCETRFGVTRDPEKPYDNVSDKNPGDDVSEKNPSDSVSDLDHCSRPSSATGSCYTNADQESVVEDLGLGLQRCPSHLSNEACPAKAAKANTIPTEEPQAYADTPGADQCSLDRCSRVSSATGSCYTNADKESVVEDLGLGLQRCPSHLSNEACPAKAAKANTIPTEEPEAYAGTPNFDQCSRVSSASGSGHTCEDITQTKTPADLVLQRWPSQRSAPSRRVSLAQSLHRSASRRSSRGGSDRQRNPNPPEFPDDYRRVDVHWVVRTKNHLGWFSDLLNAICRSQIWHRKHDGLEHPHLDIRIQTHVSQKRKEIATHVYRWLLEFHRTEERPESPLTGLINSTHFGRPDFVNILDAHYDDMMRYRVQYGFDRDGDGKNDRFKVGVFFCGAPMVGEIIADRCRLLTARGREDGSRIEYYFHLEVFG